MKQVTCLDCEKVFENDERDAMLGDMYKHYMEEHTKIITSVDEEGKKKWMEEFDIRWGKA